MEAYAHNDISVKFTIIRYQYRIQCSKHIGPIRCSQWHLENVRECTFDMLFIFTFDSIYVIYGS